MTDDLLGYYNRELSAVRQLAAEFATAYPKVAGRLRLGPDGSEDPHVERLLEGFAYLTARVRHKLDDDFPEFAQAVLGVLYPHYLAPVPSCAIAQIDLDPGQNELTTGLAIPRGQAVETEPIQGEPCRFRTAYPVTLWPIDVRQAGLMSAPFTAPRVPAAAGAAAVLRISLGCRSAAGRFAAFPIRRLRFFLHGQSQQAARTYELLLNHAVAVGFATGPDDPDPVVCKPTCLRPVGFDRDEGLLPYPARSFVGYRLLTEFFAFPAKFLFVDVDVPPEATARAGHTLDLFVYLDRSVADLEPYLSADTFRLGCTPVVNLYHQRAEPIRLTQTDPEYRVVPDLRRPRAHEVYSVDRVVATAPDGREQEYHPFFAVRHGSGDGANGPFWHATRRPAHAAGGRADVAPDHGTEVALTFVDAGFTPAAPANWTVHVETTCLNRDLPAHLPFGGGQPRLQLGQGAGAVTRVRCLTPPTPTLRSHLRRDGLWRLVSHLNLNHLSVVDGPEGANALRELLELYDFTGAAETRATIEGVVAVGAKRVTGWAGGALCRGVEVEVRFDDARYPAGGPLLFGSVLDRFFALYASVNSFTRTVATVTRREGVYKRWPARVGETILL